MNFEFDRHKSLANQSKHGISLEEAQKLWLGVHIQIPARLVVEKERWMIVGKLEGRFYSCIFTFRREAIWLISARRSREDEEGMYHGQIKKEADCQGI